MMLYRGSCFGCQEISLVSNKVGNARHGTEDFRGKKHSLQEIQTAILWGCSSTKNTVRIKSFGHWCVENGHAQACKSIKKTALKLTIALKTCISLARSRTSPTAWILATRLATNAGLLSIKLKANGKFACL